MCMYKNGSIIIFSRSRISMERFVAKVGSKMYHGYNLVHKIPWVTLFCFLATFLATFASRGHNSSLDEIRCKQNARRPYV